MNVILSHLSVKVVRTHDESQLLGKPLEQAEFAYMLLLDVEIVVVGLDEGSFERARTMLRRPAACVSSSLKLAKPTT